MSKKKNSPCGNLVYMAGWNVVLVLYKCCLREQEGSHIGTRPWKCSYILATSITWANSNKRDKLWLWCCLSSALELSPDKEEKPCLPALVPFTAASVPRNQQVKVCMARRQCLLIFACQAMQSYKGSLEEGCVKIWKNKGWRKNW